MAALNRNTLKQILILIVIQIACAPFGFSFTVGTKVSGHVDTSIEGNLTTTLKIDPKVLDAIGALPEKTRESFNKLLKESLPQLDELAKGNSEYLVKKLEELSFKAAIQWSCAANNVVNETFNRVDSLIPKINMFYSQCERASVPEDTGYGPTEKVDIAECRIYNAINSETPIKVIAAKIEKLQHISAGAVCLLQESVAADSLPDAWTRTLELGLRYVTWHELISQCDNPKNCLKIRFKDVKRFALAADQRDLGDSVTRLHKAWSSVQQEICDLKCIEEALVELRTAEREIIRNHSLRDKTALSLMAEASKYLDLTKDKIKSAQESARTFENLETARNQITEAK
jgi:hypothetical protein